MKKSYSYNLIRRFAKKYASQRQIDFVNRMAKFGQRLIYKIVFKLPEWLSNCFGYQKCELIDCKTAIQSLDKKNFILLSQREYELAYTTTKYFPDFLNWKTDIGYVNSLKQYSILLKNVIVCGGSDIIILDKKKAIYELVGKPCFPKINVTSDYGILLGNQSKALIYLGRTQKIIESGVKLTANYSFNYYHFCFQVIDVLCCLEKLKINPNVPLILDEEVMHVKNFRDFVSLVNPLAREIITLKKGEVCKVKNLYYITSSNVIVPDYKDKAKIEGHDFLFDKDFLSIIDNVFSPYYTPTETYPERIFISRRKGGLRRKFNEMELLDIFRNYGFVETFPEEYTITEQAALFHNAKFIAGGTGAAFTNLVFCSPGSNVTIFTSLNEPLSIFSTIAALKGVDLTYFSQKDLKFSSLRLFQSNFEINTEEVKSHLSKIFNS